MPLQESKFFPFISDGLEYSELLTRWNGLHIHRETDLSTCLRFSAENTRFQAPQQQSSARPVQAGLCLQKTQRGLVSFHRKLVLQEEMNRVEKIKLYILMSI